MLERVPATAESTAHLFLRSLEKPCRSARCLDPTFWRNGAEDITTPAWWPLYLQKIRQIDYAPSFALEPASTTNQPGSRWYSSARSSHSSPHSATSRLSEKHHDATLARTYSSSTARHQGQAPQTKIYDTFGLTEEIEPEHEDKAEPTHLNFKELADKDGEENDLSRTDSYGVVFNSFSSVVDEGTDLEYSSAPAADATEEQNAVAVATFDVLPVAPKTSEDERLQLERTNVGDHKQMAFWKLIYSQKPPTPENCDKLWTLFLSFRNQEEAAEEVFLFLNRSQDSKHFNRALEAFRLVPRDQRKAEHYEIAMRQKLKLFQHKAAMDLAFEGVIVTQSSRALQDLLAHFVGHSLWNSAAELLFRSQTARLHMGEIPIQDSGPLLIRRPVVLLSMTDMLQHCRHIENLHLNAFSLAERVSEGQPIFIEHRLLLKELCTHLAVMSAESEQILSKITTPGLLALLDLEQQLASPDLELHSRVLKTFARHPERKSLAELFLVAYRNMRFVWPDKKVHAWMLERLLRACEEANLSVNVQLYLLHEFRTHVEKPDKRLYLRVLSSCSQRGSSDVVDGVLQSYIEDHGKPQVQAMLNPLIYSCAVNGDVVGARRQFNRVSEEFDLEPNIYCWNSLLLAHARSNDDRTAFDVYSEMVEKGFRGTSHTYGTLLAVCAAHADAEKALELWQDARDYGIEINVPMVGSVVGALLKNDNIPSAMNFTLAITQSGTAEPLTHLWNHFIAYYARKRDRSGLLRIRDLMAEHNVRPDKFTYTGFVAVLVSAGRTPDALNILREAHFNGGVEIDWTHYSYVLYGFLREGNRNMAALIQNEMRERFSLNTAGPSVLQQLQPVLSDADDASTRDKALLLLSATLDNVLLENPLRDTGRAGDLAGQAATASVFVGMMVESMVQAGQFDHAQHVLNHVERKLSKEMSLAKKRPTLYHPLILGRMSLAVATGDDKAIGDIWNQLFDHARIAYGPLKKHGIANIKYVEEDAPPQVLSPWRFELSRYLTRYMEFMAKQGREKEIQKFLDDTFFPAGFELSGIDKNKYVQVLCRSRNNANIVKAFAMFEDEMLIRAQNWTNLIRGNLRSKTKQYLNKPLGERDGPEKRPIVQTKTTYDMKKRNEELLKSPERSIPTYTTAVHLAAALQYGASKKDRGDLLNQIERVANKTKKFLQYMPRQNDPVQKEVLRGLDKQANLEARPRSEEFYEDHMINGGLIGSQSPLDRVPTDLLDVIDSLVDSTANIASGVLRPIGPNSFQPKQRHDIEIGEQLTGPIPRTPIILPRKGRLETEDEMQRRILRQEQQKSTIVQKLREDLGQRRLVKDMYTGDLDDTKPIVLDHAGPDVDVVPSSSTEKIVLDSPKTTLQQLVRSALTRPSSKEPTHQPAQQSAIDVSKESEEPVRRLQLNRDTDAPMHKLSVSEQLARLSRQRKEKTERLANGTRTFVRAIPYANRRRIIRKMALRQRIETLENLAEHTSWDMLSPRALAPRSKAARGLLLQQRAVHRRAVVRQHIADLKAGKRLAPLPKSLRGYRAMRVTRGPVAVRFVADLGRRKGLFKIRRGLIPDRRLKRVKDNKVEKEQPEVETKGNKVEVFVSPNEDDDIEGFDGADEAEKKDGKPIYTKRLRRKLPNRRKRIPTSAVPIGERLPRQPLDRPGTTTFVPMW